MSKTFAVRKLGALVPMAALLLASSHMASAQHVLLAFNSFEDDPGELGFVTSLVAPDPLPATGTWWVYPNGNAPAPGQSDGPIFFSDGFNDFFTVNYPGILNLISPANPATIGRHGIAELAAEDVSQDGISSGTASITFDMVDINGYSDVQVRMLVASTDQPNFEVADFIRVEVKAPFSPTINIGQFRGSGAPDNRMALDTNFSGVGDGAQLSTTYQEFVFSVPEGLVEFQLEIDVDVDGNEEVFIDHIRIEGVPGSVVRDPIGLIGVTALDFGRVEPSDFAERTFTITNHPNSTENLIIDDSSTFVGANADVFTILTPLPLSIPPGEEGSLTIRIDAPSDSGFIVDATLQVNSNDNLVPTNGVTLIGRVPAVTPVTVEVSGVDNIPATFATIDAAVEWLDVNAIGSPWVIDVTTDGPAVEPSAIEITNGAFGGVTINGDADGNGIPYTGITDATVPGSQANYASAGTFSVFTIQADAADYILRDLVFIPAFVGPNTTLDSTVGPGNGVRFMTIDDYANGPGVAKNVVLENILAAGSKAGNVPAANPDVDEWTSVTRYGRGINVFSSPTSEGTPQSTMVFNQVRLFYADIDVHLNSADYTDVSYGPGCIFAFGGGWAFRMDGMNFSSLDINGSQEERILIRGSSHNFVGRESIWINQASPLTWTRMRWVDVIDNGGEVEFGNSQGPELMEFCRFAFNDYVNSGADGNNTGVRYGSPTNANVSPITTRIIRNVTFHDGLNPAGTQYGLNFMGQMSGLTFNLENSIISGAGDTGIHLFAGADSTLNLESVSLVADGPHGLVAPFAGTFNSAGNFAVNQSNVINIDPQYATTTYEYYNSNDFLRPTNPAYATAGAGGGALVGGAGPGAVTPAVPEALYIY